MSFQTVFGNLNVDAVVDPEVTLDEGVTSGAGSPNPPSSLQTPNNPFANFLNPLTSLFGNIGDGTDTFQETIAEDQPAMDTGDRKNIFELLNNPIVMMIIVFFVILLITKVF